MVHPEKRTHREDREKAGQYAGQDPYKDRRQIFLQKLDLLIQRNCKAHRCRSQKIADIFRTAVITFIIDTKTYKKPDHDQDRDQKRIQNCQFPFFPDPCADFKCKEA